MPGVGTLYLALYNALSAAGWAYVDVLIFKFLAENADKLLAFDLSVLSSMHEVVFPVVLVVQCAAILEVVHAVIGLVRASAFMTAVQVASRVWLVLGVCLKSEAGRESPFFTLMVLSWGLVEVPRYIYLLLNTLSPSGVPYPLTWLRYSLFMILYPTGITGEIGTSYYALQDYLFVTGTPPLSILLPNAFNILYHHGYVVAGILPLYIPGGPTMYSHMLKQRAKKLADEDKTKTE